MTPEAKESKGPQQKKKLASKIWECSAESEDMTSQLLLFIS